MLQFWRKVRDIWPTNQFCSFIVFLHFSIGLSPLCNQSEGNNIHLKYLEIKRKYVENFFYHMFLSYCQVGYMTPSEGIFRHNEMQRKKGGQNRKKRKKRMKLEGITANHKEFALYLTKFQGISVGPRYYLGLFFFRVSMVVVLVYDRCQHFHARPRRWVRRSCCPEWPPYDDMITARRGVLMATRKQCLNSTIVVIFSQQRFYGVFWSGKGTENRAGSHDRVPPLLASSKQQRHAMEEEGRAPALAAQCASGSDHRPPVPAPRPSIPLPSSPQQGFLMTNPTSDTRGGGREGSNQASS